MTRSSAIRSQWSQRNAACQSQRNCLDTLQTYFPAIPSFLLDPNKIIFYPEDEEGMAALCHRDVALGASAGFPGMFGPKQRGHMDSNNVFMVRWVDSCGPESLSNIYPDDDL